MPGQPQAYIPTHVWNGLGPLQARIDAQNARKYETERENYRLGAQLSMQQRQMDEAAAQRGQYMDFLNRQLEAKKQAEANAITKSDEAADIERENEVNRHNSEADATMSNLNTQMANLDQIETAIKGVQANIADPQKRDQMLKEYERTRQTTIQMIQDAGRPYGIQLGVGGVSGRYKLTSPTFWVYDKATKRVSPTKENPFSKPFLGPEIPPGLQPQQSQVDQLPQYPQMVSPEPQVTQPQMLDRLGQGSLSPVIPGNGYPKSSVFGYTNQ